MDPTCIGQCNQKQTVFFTGLCLRLDKNMHRLGGLAALWFFISQLNLRHIAPLSKAILQFEVVFCQTICHHQSRREPVDLGRCQNLLDASNIHGGPLLCQTQILRHQSVVEALCICGMQGPEPHFAFVGWLLVKQLCHHHVDVAGTVIAFIGGTSFCR